MKELIEPLLALLERGLIICLAMALGGALLLVAHRHAVWPATLVTADHLPWIVVATWFGAVVVVIRAALAAWAGWRRWLNEDMRPRWRRLFAANNLNALTADEFDTLIWMSIYNHRYIEGFYFESPIHELIKKGVLIPNDKSELRSKQMMKINPRIFAIYDDLRSIHGSDLPSSFRDPSSPPFRRHSYLR